MKLCITTIKPTTTRHNYFLNLVIILPSPVPFEIGSITVSIKQLAITDKSLKKHTKYCFSFNYYTLSFSSPQNS